MRKIFTFFIYTLFAVLAYGQSYKSLWIQTNNIANVTDIYLKSDTSTWIVGGNFYFLIEPASIFSYSLLDYYDYEASAVFWNNNPTMDTIASLNFWCPKALFGTKPYEQLKIFKVDTSYKHFCSLYSQDYIYFREWYMNSINSIVYSSELNNFHSFDTLYFDNNVILNLDSISNSSGNFISTYYTITGKLVSNISKSGLYIKKVGNTFTKVGIIVY